MQYNMNKINKNNKQYPNFYEENPNLREKNTVVVTIGNDFHYVKDDYNYKLNAFSLMLYCSLPLTFAHQRLEEIVSW